MNTPESLPQSWAVTEIEEVLSPDFNGKTIQQGWSPKCERHPSQKEDVWAVLKTTAIQEREFQEYENKQLPDTLEAKPQIEVKKGDLLMTCAGPRNRCGVSCLVESTRPKLMMSGKMYRFRPYQGHYHAKFLLYYLHTRDAASSIDAMKTGINDSGLNLTHDRFRALNVPVAPYNEQIRIVKKIEELFTELDKGIESLKKAREQLKIYRQALLKQAFEGKLTEQWRKDNPDKLESAEQLLERIKQEREARQKKQLEAWESSVKKWQSTNRDKKKPTRPRAFQAPAALTSEEREDLSELPDYALWVKVGQIFDVFVGATPSRKNDDYWCGEIPWVSSGEVAFCTIESTEEKITEEGYQNTSTLVHPQGTVMLAMIGEGKTRGQAAILNIEAAHNQNTAAIRVSETECSASFFYYYLMYKYQITRMLGSGNNQKALNKERVSNMTYPMFTADEQEQIAKVIEEKITVLDHLEGEILADLNKSEALRQAVLKKAYSGQLVSQDPSDEPASVLLGRLVEEKKEAKTTKKISNKKSTRKAS